MPDRIASDTSAVSTYRARVTRYGGTRVRCLRVHERIGLEEGETIRLVLGGDSRFAPVEIDSRSLLIRGAFDDRQLARSREGKNRLHEWFATREVNRGATVEFDEVSQGQVYGLREPGERILYEIPRRADESLRNIAESITDG